MDSIRDILSLGIVTTAALAFGLSQDTPKKAPLTLTTAQPAAPSKPRILHFIDSDGRNHYVRATDILRVETATFPPGHSWIVVAGTNWGQLFTINADSTAVARVWAETAGLEVHPQTLGMPPMTAPKEGGVP